MAYWWKDGVKQIHTSAYYEQYENQGKLIYLIAITFLDKAEKVNADKRVLTIWQSHKKFSNACELVMGGMARQKTV